MRWEVIFDVVMSEAAIPLEVQQFVNRHIFSVEQLEILLTLSANPERVWSVSDVFQIIKSNEKSIAERLEMFRRDGLVIETEGKYRFATESPDVTELISKLAVVYRERSVAVIELIYKDPARQMRHFAEAFKFKKET
jgi:hypothetical protein